MLKTKMPAPGGAHVSRVAKTVALLGEYCVTHEFTHYSTRFCREGSIAIDTVPYSYDTHIQCIGAEWHETSLSSPSSLTRGRFPRRDSALPRSTNVLFYAVTPTTLYRDDVG